MDKFFKTLARLVSSSIFTRQIRKLLGIGRGKKTVRGKTLARLDSGFLFLLANPEVYSH
jgi:hypothetical protein